MIKNNVFALDYCCFTFWHTAPEAHEVVSCQEALYKAGYGHKLTSLCKNRWSITQWELQKSCAGRVYYPLGSTRACEGTSAEENLGKSSRWLVGQMFLCHAGLLETSDPKWSYNFQKPEVTTVCISVPFCCCHSTRAKLLLNVLSLGIRQSLKPHKSHDQWWVCSSIVRSKPLQNTKTHTLHIFLTVFCVSRKIILYSLLSPFPRLSFWSL